MEDENIHLQLLPFAQWGHNQIVNIMWIRISKIQRNSQPENYLEIWVKYCHIGPAEWIMMFILGIKYEGQFVWEELCRLFLNCHILLSFHQEFLRFSIPTLVSYHVSTVVFCYEWASPRRNWTNEGPQAFLRPVIFFLFLPVRFYIRFKVARNSNKMGSQ